MENNSKKSVLNDKEDNEKKIQENNSSKKTIKEYQSQITVLNQKIEKLDKKIEMCEKNNEKLRTNLNQIQTENKKLEENIQNNNNENMKIFDSFHNQFSLIFLNFELKPKGILEKSHKINQELLNFFVNICKKYELTYWLDFGTLLGAARHEGFIPWDDDIDVGMMRKDYEKFLEIIDEELSVYNLEEDILITLNDRVDKGFRLAFLQMSYLTYTKGVIAGIDIFPYDFITDKKDNLVNIFHDAQRKFIEKNNAGENMKPFLDNYFQNNNIRLNDGDYIISGIENNMKGYNSYAYDFYIYEKKDILPVKEITFCEKIYCAPHNLDLYLKSLFNDYNEIPKVIRHHNMLKNISEKYSESYLDELYYQLKSVNQKYENSI